MMYPPAITYKKSRDFDNHVKTEGPGLCVFILITEPLIYYLGYMMELQYYMIALTLQFSDIRVQSPATTIVFWQLEIHNDAYI